MSDAGYEAATTIRLLPGARQPDDLDELIRRFRPRDRALTEEEKKLHDDLKAAYTNVEDFISRLAAGRYRTLALTALGVSCLWAIKELTSDRHRI